LAGAHIVQPIGTVQLPILGRIVMGIRFSGMLLAVVTAAFVIAPGLPALAQSNLPGVGGSNTSDRMGGGGGTGKGTAIKTVRGSAGRMGGGGGGKGAAGLTDRMGGGGGGKGAVQLNPQPEPPGRTK
jgi:hypothetical protein